MMNGLKCLLNEDAFHMFESITQIFPNKVDKNTGKRGFCRFLVMTSVETSAALCADREPVAAKLI